MSATPSDPRSVLPEAPVAPQTFVEDVIPALFAELELPAEAREVELRLGIVLLGPGGGEWTLHFVEGELGIESTRDPRCDLTLVQRVDDWRAALWEGRPAFVAAGVRALFGAAGDARVDRVQHLASATVDPAVVEEVRTLRGRVDVRVEVGTDPGPAGSPEQAWWLAVQLGPGPIAGSPSATIALAAEQAEAIHRGELHPLEALITGQLRLDGDLGLILQLQALALRATLPGASLRGPLAGRGRVG